MKRDLAACALLLAIAGIAGAAEQPRVYITESEAVQLSAGDSRGNLSLAGGTSPQSVEVMKTFSQRCPDVVITANRDKAEYVVRLDHEALSPTTPFVHGNKVAVFDKNDDPIYSDSTHTLASAVKGACKAIHSRPGA